MVVQSYSGGQHGVGCHKCGGVPGSPTKDVPILYQCMQCGFFTCNKHLAGGALGRSCPNCQGKKLRKAMDRAMAKTAKSGGLPEHAVARSSGGGGGGGGGASVQGGAQERHRPESSQNNQVAGAGQNSPTEMQFRPREDDPDKAQFDYTNTSQPRYQTDSRVQIAMRQSLGDTTLDISKISVDNKTVSLSEAGLGYGLAHDETPGTQSRTIDLQKAANATVTVEKDERGNERVVMERTDGTQVVLEEKRVSEGEEVDEEDIEALLDMDRLVNDHKRGGHIQHSSLTDAYFRISGPESFAKYKENLELMRGVSSSLISLDAANTGLLQEFLHFVMNNRKVFAAIGISPTSIRAGVAMNVAEMVGEPLRQSAKVIGVGEIGLDLHYAPYTRAEQEKLFHEQIALAVKYEKPVYLTSKKADAELYQMVSEIMHHTPFHGVVTPVIRTPELLQMALEFDFYVLVRPEITHAHEEIYRECIREVPRNRLLLGSGNEFGAPSTQLGRWNSPRYLPDTLHYLLPFFGYRSDEKHKLEDMFTRSLLTLIRIGNHAEQNDKEGENKEAYLKL